MSLEPQRRRFQFSLRWMLGALTVFAVLFAAGGYLLQQWNEGRRLSRMNDLILSNGGYWGVDGVGRSITLDHSNKTQLVTVLKELNSFDGHTSMCFNDGEFCDAHFKEILCHRGIRNLGLNNTFVTDAGLKDVAVLKELIDLELDNTGVTDAGMEFVAQLPELQYLTLDKDAITDAGLEQLARLPKLKHLHVTGTKVTDEGIAKLKRTLPKLEVNVYYGRSP